MKKFKDVDAWAFESFDAELQLHETLCESSECPALARKLRSLLSDAVVQRKCGCGEAGCHTYKFDAVIETASVRTMAFQTFGGWDAFLLNHVDGVPVDVEILKRY